MRRFGSSLTRRCLVPQPPAYSSQAQRFRTSQPGLNPRPTYTIPNASLDDGVEAEVLPSASLSEAAEVEEMAAADLCPRTPLPPAAEATPRGDGGSHVSSRGGSEAVPDEAIDPAESPAGVLPPRLSVPEAVPEDVPAERAERSPCPTSRTGSIPEVLPGEADDRQPAATQTLWQPHPPVAERQHRGRAVREAGAAQPDMQLGDHEVTYGKSTGQDGTIAVRSTDDLEELVSTPDEARQEWRRAVQWEIDRNRRAVCLAEAKRQRALAAAVQQRKEEQLERRRQLQEAMGRREHIRRRTARQVKEAAWLASRLELPSLALLAKEHAFVCGSRLNAPNPPASSSRIAATAVRRSGHRALTPELVPDMPSPSPARTKSGSNPRRTQTQLPSVGGRGTCRGRDVLCGWNCSPASRATSPLSAVACLP
eukprot:EG_transcript_10727